MFIHHRYGSSGFRVYWNVSDHITLKFSLEPHETITYSFCLSDWQQHRIAPLKLFWSADINKTLAFFFPHAKKDFLQFSNTESLNLVSRPNTGICVLPCLNSLPNVKWILYSSVLGCWERLQHTNKEPGESTMLRSQVKTLISGL